jgi:glycerol-3-phosphate dehydrogenase
MNDAQYDIVVVGGGINGCGIAADAAGRGLRVLLAEQGDLAGATSSASSKLIHGGLRYLEHYEFRLVREALAEREVLLRKAPHIVRPLRFVLPHVPSLRPRWMIRAGLFLYDHLNRRRLIPASRSIDLAKDAGGLPLQAHLRSGFAYWDCWVDDARLVVLNARAAADRGARILTRCRVISAVATDGTWRVVLEGEEGRHDVTAKALVNAAGPWVDQVASRISRGGPSPDRGHLRLVKGSHLIVPRIVGAEDAYLLQSADGRVVFALPFEENFTIIGTTDLPYEGDPARVAIDAEEVQYLLDVANRFFKTPLKPSDQVWSYSGVRPLYDDHSRDPSAVTRDYKLELAAGSGHPPLLTVMGGKVTTYRRLAEEALSLLSAHLPHMRAPWTADAPLPGGDIPAAQFESWLADQQRRYASFGPEFVRQLARRHGSELLQIIGNAKTIADMGKAFGGGLTEREVLHMKAKEWARTGDDVLWRRSKVGLHLAPADRKSAAHEIERLL